MKKRLIIIVSILVTLLIVGCSHNLTNPALEGFYQSRMKTGYHIQFSFHDDNNTFVGYINNIEINKGTYEALGYGKYILRGDREDLEVKLEKDDSFNLNMENLVKKLNGNEPIKMKNVNKVPVYFETVFSNDIENLLK